MADPSRILRLCERRARLLGDGRAGKGPVVYWMSRDQRANDNWALLFAQAHAMQKRVPVAVTFCLASRFLKATEAHYHFMLEGLREVEDQLASRNIPFFLLRGDPGKELPAFLKEISASLLISDFDPLKPKQEWKKHVARLIHMPFFEVDAHNIVPCWTASPKQEYAARTFRPKIQKLLPDFLSAIPRLQPHPVPIKPLHSNDWPAIFASSGASKTSPAVDRLHPAGEKAAKSALQKFLRAHLEDYARDARDPTCNGQSGLSPYLHFGQISAQHVALRVTRSNASRSAKKAFLEELIVRRELSDNYCFYNSNYDSVAGLPQWARRTLEKHRTDKRDPVYSRKELDMARTHDSLWNAAQRQMKTTGKMHGFMRMYWAKKILEWTDSPEEALETALLMNNRYELDGRDPNGYVGVQWSIGGLHDQAWKERPIFGKVRYMSLKGCKRKFDIDTYIEEYGKP